MVYTSEPSSAIVAEYCVKFSARGSLVAFGASRTANVRIQYMVRAVLRAGDDLLTSKPDRSKGCGNGVGVSSFRHHGMMRIILSTVITAADGSTASRSSL